MKKRLLFVVLLGVGVFGLLQINDPLRTLTEFLIAGIVPGTDISLGLLPSLSLAIVIFWLLKRWFKSIRLEMLGATASQIGKEKIKSEFITKNSGETATSRPSSVVIAPAPDSSR